MNAPNKSGWRPALNLDRRGGAGTATGNKALMLEEPLIFEIGTFETTGVDLPDVEISTSRLGGFERKMPLDLAGLTEPEAMPGLAWGSTMRQWIFHHGAPRSSAASIWLRMSASNGEISRVGPSPIQDCTTRKVPVRLTASICAHSASSVRCSGAVAICC